MAFRKRCLFVVLSLILLLSSCGSNLPNDEQMIADFYENEAEFEALIDKVEVWEKWSWMTPVNAPKLSAFFPPLSKAQASEIQAQMVKLGVRGLLVDPEPGDGTDGLVILMMKAATGDGAKKLRTYASVIRSEGFPSCWDR